MIRMINNFFGVGLMLSAMVIWFYLPEESFIINGFLFLGFSLVISNEIIAPIIAKRMMNKDLDQDVSVAKEKGQ